MGLIPAHAGNTEKISSLNLTSWAHPRSRGEHVIPERRRGYPLGSSPLARGTRHRRHQSPESNGLIPARAGNTRRVPPPGVQGGGVGGLIPARAGNTLQVRGARRGSGAHPRSRGEHGCVHGRVMRFHNLGLIPARAGNTWCWYTEAPVTGAHPRSRGEHRAALARLKTLTGSSPLARGTLVTHLCDNPLCGLIPARAGNTLCLVKLICHDLGSSPLARGTRGVLATLTATVGLIPARAGNTV